MSGLRDVAVIGIGQTTFGKFPELSFIDMGRQAAADALKDAGVPAARIETAAGSRFYSDITSLQSILATLGIAGIEMTNVENACAGGSTAVRAVWKDIAYGLYDIGLVVGVEAMTRHLTKGGMLTTSDEDLDAQLGRAVPVSFALTARRLMETHGATIEDFALVSAKAHDAGALNPRAQYRKTLSVEDILASRMIADPITLLQCCPSTDGAAALVLCSADVARQYTSNPIFIRASTVLSGGLAHAQTDPTTYMVGRTAAAQAYEQAGLGPDALDLVELHDAFAPEEIIHYEDLGLCARGDGPALLRSGATSLGGRVPVNPSGGLLSLGHPLGASGVRTVCEVVQQLRGDAGARQVEGARVGLAQMLGGAPSGLEAGACGIHILTT